jgi:TolA-binding protein
MTFAQTKDSKQEAMQEIYSSTNDKKSKMIKEVENLTGGIKPLSEDIIKKPSVPNTSTTNTQNAAKQGIKEASTPKTEQSFKKFEGRDMYNEGLKLYQDGKYEEAIAKLKEFISFYPDGKYNENAFYLIADAYYNLAQKDDTINQSAIDAYKSATSKFPKSIKREMALLRIGKLYAKMKFYIEAKASLQNLINEYPNGKYAPQSLINKAEILMDEKRYKEAHKQLERVLVLYPFSTVVRDATFKIADSYFIEKDYIRAEELYREAVKKWPTFPKANPTVMSNLGETYFMNGKYADAREVFFDMINLFPTDASAVNAMLRIGDTYYKDGKNINAVLVYSEAISRYHDSPDIYSIRMKMANVGAETPNLVSGSAIFDYTPYVEPMNTYEDVIVKSPSEPLVQEAMFRKGSILSEENRYVEAIATFKDLLSKYPDEIRSEEVRASLRDTFFKIIDTYHTQKGFYTLLFAYYKNFAPFLKILKTEDIKDSKILFKIGDSYQQMGLYSKAVEIYDAALKYDSKGIYKKDITFRTGEAYYLEDRYADAEKQLTAFLKTYPDSEMADDARWIIGDCLYNQGKFKEAIAEYNLYIKKKPKEFKTAKVYYNLASSYKNLKAFQESINSYSHAIEILKLSKREDAQDIMVDGEYQILDSLFKMGRYVEAIETADRLSITYPDDKRTEWALYIAANSYERLKKEDKSIVTLTKLAEIAKGSLFGNIASAEIKNLEWKDKYKEFYK